MNDVSFSFDWIDLDMYGSIRDSFRGAKMICSMDLHETTVSPCTKEFGGQFHRKGVHFSSIRYSSAAFSGYDLEVIPTMKSLDK